MKWKIKPKAPTEFIEKFPEHSPLIAQLLYDRGLKSQEQIDEFFNPDYQEDFHNPFLLKDMDKAVNRIVKAINKEERILIYGDYDTDGVCSIAVLFLTLKFLGAKNLRVYIPDRDKEGHGFNENAVKQSAKDKVDLIITVDCGSRNFKEVDLANSLGMDVIITDHHETDEGLPLAEAVINFHRQDDKYPFKYLAGAGVAYKLACALLSEKQADPNEVFKKWLLDLVAIATVSDVMPIIGENRTIVLYGLGVLAQTRWTGLQELLAVAQVQPKVIQHSVQGEAPATNLNTFTLGFVLGPRLNAASRMDHANSAFQLLITENRQEARVLAEQINSQNVMRQKVTEEVVMGIEKFLAEKFNNKEIPKLIFEQSREWPVGIIGLAATKIAEKYCRPTFICCEKEDVIQCSGRSIPQFDLMEGLEQCTDQFERFGGHKGAAGFSLKKEKVDSVKETLVEFSENKLKDKELEKTLSVDAELFLDDINWANYDQVQQFAPFGRYNPEPRFLVKNVEIIDLRIVGNNGKHLKLGLRVFSKDGKLIKNFKAIGFNLGQWEQKLKLGNTIDVVFEFTVDEWNGYRDLQMKIVDLRIVS